LILSILKIVNIHFLNLHTYKILKSEKFGVFKENITRTFNIPSERVQFWIFDYRQNRTIRPDAPILESNFNTSNQIIIFNFSILKSLL